MNALKSNINPSAGSWRQLSNGSWLATVTIGEGRGASRRTKSFPTAKAARTWIATIKASGVPAGEAAAMTVAQAFDNYVDSKVLATNTVEIFGRARRKAVAQGIGAIKLAALKPSQIEAFTTWLIRQDLSPMTANLYAAKLCAVLRFAAADGAMTFTPRAAKVKTMATIKVPAITAADVKALYEASPEEFAPAIILGAYTGMRVSEAAAITIGDVDFTAGTITVNKAVDRKCNYVATKTPRSMRTIPVPPEVLAQLGAACKGKPSSSPMVANSFGGIISTNTFTKTFVRVADDAGVDITFHALRKYFATTLLASGVNPVAVAKFLGDTVEVMLKTYALEQPTDAQLARNAIAAAFEATVAA